MNLRLWTHCSCLLVLFVLTASCYNQRAVPFPIPNSSLPLGHASSPQGEAWDPCVDAQFQPPIYQFANFSLNKEILQSGSSLATFNFTLVDVANKNRTLQCEWEEWWSWRYWARWEPGCRLSTTSSINGSISSSRHLGLLNLDPQAIAANRATGNPIGVIEYWFCDIGSNASFPQVYQSRAQLSLPNITCPGHASSGVTVPCTVPQLPLTAKAQWQPAGPLPGTPQLQPRPSPPPRTSGLDPRPSEDCTAVSLAHPDWTVSDLAYKPKTENDRAPMLTFSLASRAFGANVTCEYVQQDQTTEQLQTPACVPQPNSNLETSRSKLALRFRPLDQRLFVQEDWICGDTKGTYSTNFTAAGDASIPSNTSTTTSTIRGSLLKPVPLTPTRAPAPPNANNPGCTRSLEGASWPWRSIWGFSHFLYESTRRATVYSSPGLSDFSDPIIQRNLVPYTRTLQFTLTNYANNYTASCTLDDPALDNATTTAQTWFSCPPLTTNSSLHRYPQYPIQTYILLDHSTSTLKINQTWYCNDTGKPYRITAQGRTSPAPYDLLNVNGPGNRIICGSGTNIARNVTCVRNLLVGNFPCDIFLTSQWCSLDADRSGNPAFGLPAGIYASSFDQQELPPLALASPDPAPGKWSCTHASLGKPVTWTLRPSKNNKPFTTTYWPNRRDDSSYPWEQTDSLPTRLTFDLASSAFSEIEPPERGTGIINNIGTMVEDYAGGEGKLNPGTSLSLTPWLRGWNATAILRSPWSSADRNTPSGKTMQVHAGGWDFYNALEWTVRLDLATGYMELNHSWYCDDLDPRRP